MRTANLFALLTIVITACAADADDDEATGVDLDGKADGISVIGNYVLVGGGMANSDIASLDLNGDHSYVRARCYGTTCAKLVPETDHYKAVKSTSGKTYLRFERFAWTDFANYDSKQVLADAYEFEKVAGGLKLRKTYTSRWFTLQTRSDQALCSESGGEWRPNEVFEAAEAGSTTHCYCGQDPNVFPSRAFVPGQGGCVTPAATGEDDCDHSQGRYTDDDPDKLGDFCLCPIHTAPSDAGCVAI